MWIKPYLLSFIAVCLLPDAVISQGYYKNSREGGGGYLKIYIKVVHKKESQDYNKLRR